MRTAKEIKEELFDEELFATAIADVELAVETSVKRDDDYAFCTVDVRVKDEVITAAKEAGYRVYYCRTILDTILCVFSWGNSDFAEYTEL